MATISCLVTCCPGFMSLCPSHNHMFPHSFYPEDRGNRFPWTQALWYHILKDSNHNVHPHDNLKCHLLNLFYFSILTFVKDSNCLNYNFCFACDKNTFWCLCSYHHHQCLQQIWWLLQIDFLAWCGSALSVRALYLQQL